MKRETAPVAAADITEEIIELALDVADGWYQSSPIDWEDLTDRIDGAELKDGSHLNMGDSMASPAIEKLKREVRKARQS